MKVNNKKIFSIIILGWLLAGCATAIQDVRCIEGNCIDGHGIYKWDDGSIYTGFWEDSKHNGDGSFRGIQDGVEINYWGEYLDGKFHGEGDLLVGDQRYVGEFINGLPTGKGIYTDEKMKRLEQEKDRKEREKKEKEEEQKKNNFKPYTNASATLSLTEWECRNDYVTGVIKNISNKKFDYVEVNTVILNKKKNKVDDAFSNTLDLLPGQSWEFKAYYSAVADACSAPVFDGRQY